MAITLTKWQAFLFVGPTPSWSREVGACGIGPLETISMTPCERRHAFAYPLCKVNQSCEWVSLPFITKRGETSNKTEVEVHITLEQTP